MQTSLFHCMRIRSERRIRGASVYTLSEKASDSEAETLAAKENKSDIIAGVDLTEQSDTVASVLISLRQRHTMDQSAHFARFMVESLGKEVRLLRNTHRFAGFAVLSRRIFRPFWSNSGIFRTAKTRNCYRQKAFRKRVSKAILMAIDKYFARLKSLSKS